MEKPWYHRAIRHCMKFSDFTKNISEKTKQFTQKAKHFANKTLEFAGENLAKTPLFLDTHEKYDALLENKRVVLLAFDEKSDLHTEIVMMLPVWQAMAYVDITQFRYLNTEKSDLLIRTHEFTLPLEMRVFYEGKETLRLNDFDAIKAWWKQRVYDGTSPATSDANAPAAVPSALVEDPLTQK